MTTKFRTTEEVEAALGAQLRAARLAVDIDQASLAQQANVALGSLKALEAGRGANVRTLIRVVRALGLEHWLDGLYETSPMSPLALARVAAAQRPPRRASRRRAQGSPSETG